MRNGIAKKIAMLFVLCFVFYVPIANAELITINLTATVNLVQDPGNYLEGKITNGSTITGSYTYESTILDSTPDDPTVGHYWNYAQPAGVSLSLGGFEFKTDLDNVDFLVGIGNSNPGGGDDIYWFHSYNNIPLSNGASVNAIAWQLNNLAGSVFSSDALPVTTPILNQWQSNHLSVYGEEGTPNDYFFDATVTSVQLVPEPGTLLLLTLGSFILRKRNSN
jgi:hypothetical protein